ncbi:terminase large subunit [Pseudoalteromonas sp. PAMC 22718]|uniref:terminase large subunit n=1 Tax=Pseudoalteromonas sp. PAMC 22718 TaxID=1175295 RepID=UPI000312463E|nr:terminase TerL endonuclease subunit [Pseudoalteromonas sp. PAMC 22718]
MQNRSNYPTFQRDHLADIEKYASDVLSGKRPSNKYEMAAVERESHDLARAGSKDFPYYFDPEAALKVIWFLETFSHVKGKWARAKGHEGLLNLSGWQKWITAQVYGWKHIETHRRRFRTAFTLVPRKNGKSTWVAPIGLYMLANDDEPGAEVYCGATTQKQANEVFNPAKKMALKQPIFRRRFNIELFAQQIEKTTDGGKFERLIGNPGDGGSPSCYLCDEYHEHDDDDQRDTMITGMGAREQPLEWIISTAGSNWFGPCGQFQKECQEILEGTRTDETVFAMIYTIDKDDDWQSEEALRKANPNFGISVEVEFLLNQLSKARQSARKQNAFKTKHLNLWVGARESWLNLEDWLSAADSTLTMDQFTGEECTKGVDLSESDDLTADVTCFTREINGKLHYYFFAKTYVTEAKANEIDIYRDWVDQGHLIECEGTSIDYDEVERAIETDNENYQVTGLFYDPAGAAPIAQRVQNSTGIEPIKVSQNYTNFSPAMREFENLLRQGRIHHNGDPVLTWCLGNVIAKETMDGKYIRPVKEHKDNKIDTAVAKLLAFIGSWQPEEDDGSNQEFLEF